MSMTNSSKEADNFPLLSTRFIAKQTMVHSPFKIKSEGVVKVEVKR